MIKKPLLFLSAFLFSALLLSVSASAAEADHAGSVLSAEGFSSPSLLSDGDDRSHTATQSGGSVTITREGGISFLYIVFDRIPKQWTLSGGSDGTQSVCGENSFLHEYVDVSSRLGSTPEMVRLDFPAGTSIDEIYAFGEGTVPDWVQRWSPPCEQADLLLLSSHSDDEQLFFAGVLPIYAGERGLKVQVVYLVNHYYFTSESQRLRPHEQLDGLWTVGVRNYPVMSDFPDLYSESLDEALAAYRSYGFGYDDFTQFITGILRRFQPLVVVTHDVKGEYGHGTHILCATALMDALGLAADESAFPESAGLYGTWETEKAYLHLYPENPVILDLDVPLSAFGGKTALEVSQDGFEKHVSQHKWWFYGWLNGTNGQKITQASDIKTYSPCYYGLYYTCVGYDAEGGDLMENVKSYAERYAESQAPEDPEDPGGDEGPENTGNTEDDGSPSAGIPENDGPKETGNMEPSPEPGPEASPEPDNAESPGPDGALTVLAAAAAALAAAVIICVIVVYRWKRKKSN